MKQSPRREAKFLELHKKLNVSYGILRLITVFIRARHS
jgi:hypothetical protein